MNVVNEDVVVKILKSRNADAADGITQLKWQINANIIKAGNNYMSEVYRLVIEYVKDGHPEKRVLFVKVPSNSPMYETGNKHNIFLKETTVYTEVLRQIYTFEEKYFTCRVYHVDEKHTLFMKDLSQSGYKPGNRTQQLDFEHCACALRYLARLHGLSVHLEKTKGLPEVVRKDPFYNEENHDEELKQQFLVGLKQFYDHLDPSIRTKYAEKIEFFKSIEWAEIVKDLSPESSSFNVLNHGDFWTNNIMFKYDKYGIIKRAKILDFQICRWANPAIDLIYFAITSMRFEVYEKYFDLLSTIYLDTLNKILAKFDYPSYQMVDLKKDIESRYTYSIVVLTCLLPIIVSDPNNPIDMSELVKDNEFDVKAIQKTYTQKHYLEIATKWFLHLAQRDISKFENERKKPLVQDKLKFVNGTKKEIS